MEHTWWPPTLVKGFGVRLSIWGNRAIGTSVVCPLSTSNYQRQERTPSKPPKASLVEWLSGNWPSQENQTDCQAALHPSLIFIFYTFFLKEKKFFTQRCTHKTLPTPLPSCPFMQNISTGISQYRGLANTTVIRNKRILWQICNSTDLRSVETSQSTMTGNKDAHLTRPTTVSHYSHAQKQTFKMCSYS